MSCVWIACMPTSDKMKWELVFEPVPYDDEPFVQLARQMSRRFQQGKRGQHQNGVHQNSKRDDPETAVHVQEVNVCDCTETYDSQPTGDHLFPKQLKAVTCQNSSWCRKFVYPVRVLAKEDSRSCGSSSADKLQFSVDGLPEELINSKWRFVEVNVTVGCICTIAYN